MVWCAISARRILGLIFFEVILNSQRYVEEILNNCFSNLSEAAQMYGFFMKDGATAHTAGTSITALCDVYGDRLISSGFWPTRSPDLNPCDFYLWGNLKSKVYANNPRDLEALKENIRNEIFSINRDYLQEVSRNLFRRVRGCLSNGMRHFEHRI